MKKIFFLISISFALVSSSCSYLQSQTSNSSLNAQEFSDKIKRSSDASIVDVRTPEEFDKGHLVNAKNVDWNGDNFETDIEALDKNKPVFVYCLSGGRSSSAVNKMHALGFTEIYELKGGIMKWRAANLPEEAKIKSAGMTTAQFENLITSEKLVLVDFYADWCAPCKKMKPYLEEISNEMHDKVMVIRINADENQEICSMLKIDALPVLQLYKAKQQVWNNEGFISKDDVVKVIQSKK